VELLAHGKGPIIFNPDNAFAYGRWIGSRYRDYSNIIWINGGDRSGEGGNYAVWDSLGGGIKSVDQNHLMTFHPLGGGGRGYSSSRWFHECPWLDFNMAQSGHERRDLPNYELIEHDYRLTPIKPCMDGEPRYEDHCVNWNPELGWFDDYDVRQAAYWSLLAGGHGHTYGCHAVWQFLTPERSPVGKARGNWREAMDLPGAAQMKHVRTLMESRPMLSRVPDQSLVENAGASAERIMAARGDGYAFIYLPIGGEVHVNLGGLGWLRISASWFDPRSGRTTPIGTYRVSDQQVFTTLTQGRGNDWMLIIDDEKKSCARISAK
ncbi:MAG: glycoside hydrolase family 140 protein, partial [Solirubrobacterales bacterium]